MNDETIVEAEAARDAEREALMKLGYVTKDVEKSSKKAACVSKQLEVLQTVKLRDGDGDGVEEVTGAVRPVKEGSGGNSCCSFDGNQWEPYSENWIKGQLPFSYWKNRYIWKI